MNPLDLNLLVALDALLAEGSVAGAARRLQLSASATSRTLARLREVTGDPLLVRAGAGLVPTPRALELRERVATLIQEAKGVLRPVQALDLRRLVRRFTLRNREGFVETFGPALLDRIGREAPGVQLCFLPKMDRESTGLRDGSVDLETGVVGRSLGPELHAQALFQDRFVGVVRQGHRLGQGPVTAEALVAHPHVQITRRGQARGALDDALHALGLSRQVVALVGSFSEGLALVRQTDLVGVVPASYTRSLQSGLVSFELPVELPTLSISMIWHPRNGADPAHRWLRQCVMEACRP